MERNQPKARVLQTPHHANSANLKQTQPIGVELNKQKSVQVGQ
jgi:hypothetical protein